MLNKTFTHADLLGLWRGDRYLSEAARDIDVPKHRIRIWKSQNNIPPRYWPQLIKAVRSQFGIDISTDQLTAAVVRESDRKDRLKRWQSDQVEVS